PPRFTGTFTITINATTNEADLSMANNTNTAHALVIPSVPPRRSPDLSPNPVIFGSNVTFAITLSNAGPSTATGVILTNALPPTFYFVSALSSQGTVTSSSNGATFNLGSVPSGGIATMSVVAKSSLTGA